MSANVFAYIKSLLLTKKRSEVVNYMNRNVIAESLVKLRETTGYSIHELAKLIDVETEQILQWETGEDEPKISQCILLSELYGVKLNDIFCNCTPEEYLASEKVDDFKHNAWINRIANTR